MSKELQQLQETLEAERAMFDLKSLVVGVPAVSEDRPRIINGAIDISQFQTRGPLVQESQYRQQHRQQGRK